MKALVLAAGRGTRMRADADAAALAPEQAAAADAGHKAMMPFGRPFLDYVIHSLADAGVDDVALVVGADHDQIRDYYGELRTRRISISFVTQRRPLGTADAVASAEAWAGHDPFLTLNGDNLYPAGALARMTDGTEPALAGFRRGALGLPDERLAAFALIGRAADGSLAGIVEKPGEAAVAAAGRDALVSMNLWRFDARIFEACRQVPLSTRGELELPHAVALALAAGMPFDVIEVAGEVLDLSRRTDVAAVARRLDGARVDL
ncbi:MAG: nucleotidyltransferase family protein [Acidobacteriota bacterium]|nr:nucleotidyltransferase family protein [Acidobacteriota bacterium]